MMTQAFNCCGANLANTLVSIVLNFLVLPQHLWACKCPVTLLTLVSERILRGPPQVLHLDMDAACVTTFEALVTNGASHNLVQSEY